MKLKSSLVVLSFLGAGLVLGGCLNRPQPQDLVQEPVVEMPATGQALPPVTTEVGSAETAQEAADTALKEMDAAMAEESEDKAFQDDLNDRSLGL